MVKMNAVCAFLISILVLAEGSHLKERECSVLYGKPFMCGNGECIDDEWVCDKQSDCDNDHDEVNCHLRVCEDTEFRCSGGQCIQKSEECDGFPDCKDYSDEVNCLDDAALEPCMQSKRSGPCKSIYHRYYFNQITGQCEEFIYGGCVGNNNNFITMEQCELTCLAAVPKVCEQGKVVGPCRAAFPRFFFNKSTGQCEQFIYGGCGGNGNNFGSRDKCESTCLA